MGWLVRFPLLSFFLFLASSAFSLPVITSVSPAISPVAGNVQVTIKGTGFTGDARVIFGGQLALSQTVLDEGTIVARTPAHLPGKTYVGVQQQNGAVAFDFSFAGDPSTVFERFLVPVFVPPVKGAFGSEFRTEMRLWNGNEADRLQIFGLQYPCIILCPQPKLGDVPIELLPGARASGDDFEPLGTPGLFIYTRKGGGLGSFLRVYDVSREAANYGAEIRVVHEREFKDARPLLFPGVPIDPRFRIMLRIYSPGQSGAFVSINGDEPRPIELNGATLFQPSYAVFTDFPAGSGVIDVSVSPPPPFGPSPPIYLPPIWAFITITNNDTQQITTMHPNGS
jgi:hypothetical protein